MIICHDCAITHPRTAEIMVRCAGTVFHETCGWCWNLYAKNPLVYEVRPDCVSIAWEGKDKHGPQRPSQKAQP